MLTREERQSPALLSCTRNKNKEGTVTVTVQQALRTFMRRGCAIMYHEHHERVLELRHLAFAAGKGNLSASRSRELLLLCFTFGHKRGEKT